MAAYDESKFQDTIENLALVTANIARQLQGIDFRNLKNNFDGFNDAIQRTVTTLGLFIADLSKQIRVQTKETKLTKKQNEIDIKKISISKSNIESMRNWMEEAKKFRLDDFGRSTENSTKNIVDFGKNIEESTKINLDEILGKKIDPIEPKTNGSFIKDLVGKKLSANTDIGKTESLTEKSRGADKNFEAAEKQSASSKIFGKVVDQIYKFVKNIRGETPRLGLDTKTGIDLTKKQDKEKSTFEVLSESISYLTRRILVAAGVIALFVRAFNPALVENFLLTLKDLSAIIGAALQPILSAITIAFRALADTLLPAIEKLSPAFISLGNIVLNILVPIFKSLTDMFGNLTPAINYLLSSLENLALSLSTAIAKIITGLTPAIETIINIISYLANAFSALINVLSPLLNIVMPFVSAALMAFATSLIIDAVAAIVSFAASLFVLENILTLGLSGIISIIVGTLTYVIMNFSSAMENLVYFINNVIDMIMHPLDRIMGLETEFQRKEREKQENKVTQFGLTGASQSVAARKAEYSSVEDLSRNLIKAAFAGSNVDRLKSIDANGKKQVELLEQIAGQKKAPQVAAAGPAPGVAV